MIIGIDLDQTVRDLNKQINHMWEICPEYGNGTPFVDEEEVAKHDLKSEIQFNSIQERDAFYFQNYALEMYGNAPCMTMFGWVLLDSWAKNAENFLDEPIEFVVFVPFVNGMAIKASFFYMAKFIMFSRHIEFPKKAEDVWDKCDVMITANNKIATSSKRGDKVLISIDNPINDQCRKAADLNYNSVDDMVNDLMEFDNLYTLLQNKRNGKETDFSIFHDNKSKNALESKEKENEDSEKEE